MLIFTNELRISFIQVSTVCESDAGSQTPVTQQKIDVQELAAIKFLQLLILKKSLSIRCSTDFRPDQLCVFLTGSCVMECAMKIYETLASTEVAVIELSSGFVKLLATPRGENWLAEQMEQCRPECVLVPSSHGCRLMSNNNE